MYKRQVEKQVAILYATIHDHLVKVKVPDVAEYEKGLDEYLDNNAAGAAVMETIRTTGNLDKDRLADACTAEQADLAALCVGADQVHDLDACLLYTSRCV